MKLHHLVISEALVIDTVPLKTICAFEQYRCCFGNTDEVILLCIIMINKKLNELTHAFWDL